MEIAIMASLFAKWNVYVESGHFCCLVSLNCWKWEVGGGKFFSERGAPH